MNLQFNKKNVTMKTQIVILLLIALVILLYIQTNAANTTEQINQFTELVQTEHFDEAKALYNSLSNNNDKSIKNQLQVVLNKKFTEISDDILAEKKEALSQQKTVGLRLFQKDLKNIIYENVKSVTESFILGKIDSRAYTNYLQKIKEIGIHYNNEELYNNYLHCEELINKQKYDQALEILKCKLEEYPDEQLLPQLVKKYQEQYSKLVVFDGPVEHIFFHPLIAYPELAFDGDYKSKGYDDYFVTVSEFDKILEALYKNNYILINMNLIYDEETIDGESVFSKRNLLLPKGKKPLIISIDDLNYYEYMLKNGNVHKLILDEEGNVATFSITPDGQPLVSHENEIIPILDSFVNKHPDFSFQGAKAIVALTGYQGVLGYRTHNLESPDFQKEKEEALKVIKRLKETGWVFASHSYGHINIPKRDLTRVNKDTKQWKDEVESLVGPTNIFIFPYGTHVFPGDKKFQCLYDSGFRVFCYVGGSTWMSYQPKSILMDRRHIDGIAFKQQAHRLKPFFNVSDIIDSTRP